MKKLFLAAAFAIGLALLPASVAPARRSASRVSRCFQASLALLVSRFGNCLSDSLRAKA